MSAEPGVEEPAAVKVVAVKVAAARAGPALEAGQQLEVARPQEAAVARRKRMPAATPAPPVEAMQTQALGSLASSW
jgi:hypothetical protein